MKSNITFNSNIYVYSGIGKLSDETFMSKVHDPETICLLRKRGKYSSFSEKQQSIWKNALPCAFANGDHSHGSVVEDGKVVSVCKCEHIQCNLYPKCSSETYFRKIQRKLDDFFDTSKEELISPDFQFEFYDKQSPQSHIVPKVTKNKSGSSGKVDSLIVDYYTYAEKRREKVVGYRDRLDPETKGYYREHFVREEEREIMHTISIAPAQTMGDKPTLQDADTLQLDTDSYTVLQDKGKIINCSIDSQILVNAGPGTGKTYTVIERIKKLVREGNDPQGILVLCFSRSAVKVIRTRLKEEMLHEDADIDVSEIDIRTFDSFATWYLSQIDESVNLSLYDYDSRIKLFIEKYESNTELLKQAVDYVIIDEIQDLVGIRAELVKSLLSHIDCGFLLLGDSCQAIYDYQIKSKSEMSAIQLYQWICNTFPRLQKFELEFNWRQSDRLKEQIAPLRNAMLHSEINEQKIELEKVLDAFNVEMTVEEIIDCCPNSKRAVLSWSNGDAYRQSQELYTRTAQCINHTILTGSRSLHYIPEIAYLFSRCCQSTVSYSYLKNLALENNVEKGVAETIWKALSVFSKEEGFIRLSDVRIEMLKEKNVPDELLLLGESNLTISTIHKAKGKEYDSVLINYSGVPKREEDIRVYYVAVTRGKVDVVTKKNNHDYDIKSDQNRFLQPIKNSNQGKICRLELGLDGDIDASGFVSNSLGYMNAKARQTYIRNKVKRGDEISISRQNGKALIVHEGHVIGCMNPNIFCPQKVVYPSGRSFIFDIDRYTDFTQLYVTDIVTVVSKSDNACIDEAYRQSGFWLGIEFCGYAKPMEE